MHNSENNYTIFIGDFEGVFSESSFPTLEVAMRRLKKETFYALGEDVWLEYFNHSKGKWYKVEVVRKGEILRVEQEVKGEIKESPSSWKEIVTEIP